MENYKTKKQIEKLPTKRLLAYYKAVRGRKISFIAGHTCDCCGEATWDLYPNETVEKEAKAKIKIQQDYLKMIKEILNTRENVKA